MLIRIVMILLLTCSVVGAEDAPDKWEGYIEFTGKPGTTRNLGQSDLLVPLWQDKNDMSFFNLRGMTENFNDGDFSIGFGHRHMFSDFILGAYGYYDGAESDEDIYYHQWSAGIEVLGEKWDFRANGYLADNDTRQLGPHVIEDKVEVVIVDDRPWVDYSHLDYLKEERSASGFDMEVGYKLPVFEDTRVYAGMYHFFGEQGFENVTGPRVRLETRLYDLPYMGPGSRLMAGVETQSDDVRGGQTTGMLSIRIPFGIESKKPRTVLTGLDRRMMEPVIKNTNIITTQKETVDYRSARAEALNPEERAYTDYVVKGLDNNMKEIMEQVETDFIDKGKLALVVIEGEGLLEFGDDPIIGKATFTLAGEPLKIAYDNTFTNKRETFSITPQGQTPTLDFTHSGESAITLSDRAHLNGFHFDIKDFTNGFLLDSAGTAYLTNVNVGGLYKPANTYGYGIQANGADSIIRVSDSVFSGLWDRNDGSVSYGSLEMVSGLLITNGAEIYAENIEIFGVSGSGATVQGDGSYLEITESVIRNNRGHGIWLNVLTDDKTKGAKLWATFMTINENERSGLEIGSSTQSSNSYAYIADSTLRGNSYASSDSTLVVSNGGTLDGYRLEITNDRSTKGAVVAESGMENPWSAMPGEDGINEVAVINLYESVISHNRAYGLVASGNTLINVYNSVFEGNNRGIARVLYEDDSAYGKVKIDNSIFKGYRGFETEFDIDEDGGLAELTGSGNVDEDGNPIIFP